MITACAVVTSTIAGSVLELPAVAEFAFDPQPDENSTIAKRPKSTGKKTFLLLIFLLIGLFQNSPKYYLRKILRGFLVRDIEQPSLFVPKDIVQGMVYEHAEEC